MAEWYVLIRGVHVASVALSGALFAVRGVMTLAGSALPMHPAVRRLSYGIDTLLLAAALSLVALLRVNPFTTPWLATKLVLLVAYIVLGSFALKRARTRTGRALCLAAAIAVFAAIVTTAATHRPLGL